MEREPTTIPATDQRPVLLDPTAEGDATALAQALIAAARAVLRRRQQGAGVVDFEREKAA